MTLCSLVSFHRFMLDMAASELYIYLLSMRIWITWSALQTSETGFQLESKHTGYPDCIP
jgi:hypothetical protein